ncbi:hypothetical protein GEMRC1_008418 [Eukaryota sp. GEM-RC1]
MFTSPTPPPLCSSDDSAVNVFECTSTPPHSCHSFKIMEVPQEDRSELGVDLHKSTLRRYSWMSFTTISTDIDILGVKRLASYTISSKRRCVSD